MIKLTVTNKFNRRCLVFENNNDSHFLIEFKAFKSITDLMMEINSLYTQKLEADNEDFNNEVIMDDEFARELWEKCLENGYATEDKWKKQENKQRNILFKSIYKEWDKVNGKNNKDKWKATERKNTPRYSGRR